MTRPTLRPVGWRWSSVRVGAEDGTVLVRVGCGSANGSVGADTHLLAARGGVSEALLLRR